MPPVNRPDRSWASDGEGAKSWRLAPKRHSRRSPHKQAFARSSKPRPSNCICRWLGMTRVLVSRMKLSRVLLSVCCAVGASACAASSNRIHDVAASPLVPTESDATVVFLRPSGWGAPQLTVIIDSDGRYVGESLAKTQFIANVPPGDHTFVTATYTINGWGAVASRALKAKLEPGKLYFVEIGLKLGIADLFAISPRTKQWTMLKEWMNATRRISSDLKAGQAFVDESRDDMKECIETALKEFAQADEELRPKITMTAEDGLAEMP